MLSGPAQGQRFRLPVQGCVIGRTKGSILFDDPTVSPQHATLIVRDDKLSVRDEGSLSGVFVTINARENVAANALLVAGSRLFRYSGPHYPPSAMPGRPTVYGAPLPPGQATYLLEEILLGGRPGRAITSAGPLITVGQAHCDFSFPHDADLAGRHFELSPTPNGALLQDLSGGLGTFVKLAPQTERPLQPGDRIRIGQQVRADRGARLARRRGRRGGRLRGPRTSCGCSGAPSSPARRGGGGATSPARARPRSAAGRALRA